MNCKADAQINVSMIILQYSDVCTEFWLIICFRQVHSEVSLG